MPPHDVKDEDEFNQLTASKLSIVDFYAPWCGACKMFMPKFEELCQEFPSVQFLKVDVDEMEEVAESQNVNGLPYLCILQGGKQVAGIGGKDVTKPFVTEKLSQFGAAVSAPQPQQEQQQQQQQAPPSEEAVAGSAVAFTDANGNNVRFSVETVMKYTVNGEEQPAFKKLTSDGGRNLSLPEAGKGVVLPEAEAPRLCSRLLSLAAEAGVETSGFKVPLPTVDVTYFSFADPKSGNVLAFSADLQEKKVRYTVNGEPRPSFRTAVSNGDSKVTFPDIGKGCSIPPTNKHIHLASLICLIKKVGGEAQGFPQVVEM